MKQKDFKQRNTKIKGEIGKEMVYKSYSQAIRSRRRDEVTIYDSYNKGYKNIKIFPKFRKKRRFFTW